MAVLKSNSSKPQTMADLLASYKSPFVVLHKGDLINGTVTKLTSSEILIDVNAKTEAVVLEKDKKILRNILSTLNVGDQVSVSVLDPESDMGNPVVSLRRFIGDISWKRLEEAKEKKQEVEVGVAETTKGGFLVQTFEGMDGFLPNSHILSGQNPQVGGKIKAFILELNRQERKIIFSQKPILEAKDFEKIVKDLKNEQKIETIVSSITPFGVFVSIQTPSGDFIDGLIHISEISWEKVENIVDLFTVGQKITAVVIGVDRQAKRVDLSLKRLMIDPFEAKAKKYAQDQKITGKVSKILSTGVVLELEEGVEGFIRKEKIPPTVSYAVGDQISAEVLEIDKKKRRIILIPVLLEKPIGYR